MVGFVYILYNINGVSTPSSFQTQIINLRNGMIYTSL